MAELLAACKISEEVHFCPTVPLFVEHSKGLNRMLGFFLAMGVGRNLTIGGMVDWGLTKTDRAKGERLVVGEVVGR